jgi:Fe-S oxidoreductase
MMAFIVHRVAGRPALSVSTQLDYCTYCPKMCRHACPVSTTEGRETWIPQQKMARLNELRRGNAPWDADHTEALWACTSCRQCTVYCEHGVEPATVLLAGRAEATSRGVGHPALAEYPDRFRAREARLGRQLRDAIDRDRFAEDAGVAFWPGCDAVDKDLDGVRAALALFDAAGADHVRVADVAPVCGGYPLLATGYLDMFRWHAGKVAAELKRFRTVILNCSACVHAVRALYPAEGVSVNAEVLHLSEFLAQSAERLREPAAKKTVYYHDPCYLARHTGIVEPPRRVLARVAEVREFAWARSDTECCGGAGVLPKTMPAVADAMAKRRLGEIARKGGGTVVTSCATCAFMLRRNAPASVVVKDLPEAVADAVADAQNDMPT